MFTVSKDENIQKDSILNVSKSQIVGHTPIKYPGQIYDIYAGIIWQGKEIYFTSFIIQKETGDWNQYYEIKLMSDPKKLTGDSGDGGGGADELLTIKDTTVTNISQLPNDSCCIHAIESHIGFDFTDDIIGYQKYANTVEIFTMDGKIMTLNIGEDGTLTYEGIDVWAKASNVYSKNEVDGKIANYLLCYAGYPPAVEIANGGTKSVITDYFVGAAPTVNSFGIMIYYQGANRYLIDFNVIATNAEVTDVQFVSNPVQINTPDMTQYYNKSQVDEKIAEIPTIPTGVIVIWSGADDNIPSGWHICDGTDGTPDLTDKFVLGAGTTHSVGDTGGEETHKLTVEEIPEHYHTVDANASETTSGQMHGAVIIKSDGAIKRASSEVGGNKSHNNMPPYYTLCYIMKMS